MSVSLRASLRLLIAFSTLVALFALPSSALATPGTCTNAPTKDLVCALQVDNQANATIAAYGTHLDQVRMVQVDFSDGTTRTYYRAGQGTNPAGVTVDWGSPATVTQDMVDAAGLPQGFATKVSSELPAAGSKILITDGAMGGKTVTGYRFYDTMPVNSQQHVSVTVTPSRSGGWMPPLVNEITTNTDQLIIEATAGGLSSAQRLSMTCSQMGLGSSTACPSVLPSFNNPTIGATTAPSEVISWSDTKIVVKHPSFPGSVLSGFSLRGPTGNGGYAFSPGVPFAPRIDSIARTSSPRQFQISGATFGRMSHLIVRLEDGTLRRVSKPSTATASSTGVTVNTWGENSIIVTDTALKGHSIENITIFYTPTTGDTTPKAMTEKNLHLYFVGTITAIFSDAINSLTVSGEGLQAVTSLTIKFSDAVDYVINMVENDGTFNELTVTDEILGGHTVTGVIATAYDGQTMQLLGQNVTVAAPGPRFTLAGPDAGLKVGTGALVWNVNSQDPIVQLYCSVDGGAEVACPGNGISIIDYSAANLGLGTHTLTVRGQGLFASTTLAPISFQIVANPAVSISGVAEGERLASLAGRSITITSTGGPIVSQTCTLTVDGVVVSTSCASPIALDSLPAGNAQLTVESTGQPGTQTQIKTVNFLAGPAATVAIDHNSITTNGLDISFAFSAANATGAVCYLFDQNSNLVASKSSCTSPATLTAPTGGAFSIQVVASNSTSSATDSASAIIATAVNLQLSGINNGAIYPSTAGLALSWTNTGGPIASMSCGVYNEARTNYDYQSVPCTSPIDLSGFGDGYLQVQLQVTGYDGNTSYYYAYASIGKPVTLTLDRSSVSVANNTVTGQFSVTNATSVSCYVHDTNWNYYRYAYPCSSPLSISIAGLPTGTYILDIYADNAVSSANESMTLTLASAPTVNIITPSNGSSVSSPTFRYTTSGGATAVSCLLDGQPLTPCPAQSDYTGSMGALTAGSHTLQVTASNGAGSAMATSTFTAAGPQLSISYPSAGQQLSSQYQNGFGYSQVGATSVACEVDGAAISSCGSSSQTNFNGVLPLLGAGNHTLTVKATNAIATTTRSVTFQVVNPPAITITSGPDDGATVRDNAVQYGFTLSGVTSATCQLDSYQSFPCSGSLYTGSPKANPFSWSSSIGNNLGAGTHTVTITASNVGGYSQVTRTFTIERVALVTSNAATGPAFGQFDVTGNFDAAQAGVRNYSVRGVVDEAADGSMIVQGTYSRLIKNGTNPYVRSNGVVLMKVKSDLTLDTSFGDAGVLSIETSTSGDTPELVDVDGNYVYVVLYGAGAERTDARIISRYNKLTGDKDTAFGDVTVGLPAALRSSQDLRVVRNVESDGAGGVLVMGSMFHSSSYNDWSGFVARISGNAQDMAFDGDGIQVQLPAGVSGCSGSQSWYRLDFMDAVVLGSGKIVVSGTADGAPLCASSGRQMLYGLNADGSLDTAFATGGSTPLGYAAGRAANGYNLRVDLTAAGKLMVVGGGLSDSSVALYNTNGTPDNTFNSANSFPDQHVKTILGYPTGFAAQYAHRNADGSYLLGGDSPYSWSPLYGKKALVKLTANGDVDTAFGNAGIVTVNNELARSTFNAGFGGSYMGGVYMDGQGRALLLGHNVAGGTSNASDGRQAMIRRFSAAGAEG
jgi:hypothetical protein